MPYFWLCVVIATQPVCLLFLKEGTLIVGEAPENFSELAGWLVKLFSNPYTLSAVFFFVLNAICWIIAMSRLKLSFMFPFSQAAQIVLVTVFSLLLFEEKVIWLGWLGIVTICVGLFLMSMPRNISESKL